MKRQAALVSLFALVATACGEGMEARSVLATQESAVLPSGDTLSGNWCQVGWPGCASIGSGGSGHMSSGGDGCWLVGDLVFSGLTPGATAGTYVGTRYMYGTGICGYPPPRSVTITMTGPDSFTEVAGDFSADWVRSP
ncbi:hypothetical protein D7Y13_20980 [Corallococcus praedator]|uniref:Lipoprotein n=1 Tax=Corallococcus praedator TaxID=2316724 RepID=A0ABX9QEW8_9BACT|nr:MULTISPECIES: hypothetical protein [Corallococcus]RKH27129.1 hypothetical protein D7X75_27040 [Corallococcus sp. CA031C]RKI06083.1 hypothetical protein D7Y13_20980 [Corallococcus praedator]